MITVLRHPLTFPAIFSSSEICSSSSLSFSPTLDLLVGKGDLPGQFTPVGSTTASFSVLLSDPFHTPGPPYRPPQRWIANCNSDPVRSDRPCVHGNGHTDGGGTKAIEYIGNHIVPIQITGNFSIHLGFGDFECPIKSHGPAAKNPSASIPSSDRFG